MVHDQQQTDDVTAATLKFVYYCNVESHKLAAVKITAAQANDICDALIHLIESGRRSDAVVHTRVLSLTLSVIVTMASAPARVTCVGAEQVILS